MLEGSGGGVYTDSSSFCGLQGLQPALLDPPKPSGLLGFRVHGLRSVEGYAPWFYLWLRNWTDQRPTIESYLIGIQGCEFRMFCA